MVTVSGQRPAHPSEGAGRERLAVGLAAAAIVLAVAAAYAGSLHGPWIFDDKGDIVTNERVHALWPPAWARSARPVVWLSFALNHALGGLDPFGYHVANVILHAAAALLAFGLIRKTLRLDWVSPAIGARATEVAAAAALLWALHPLHTSAVTYVVHRYEVVASLFYLGALLSFAASLDSAREARWRAAVVAAAVLAALSKEIAVTLPVVLLLYDSCFGAGSLRAALAKRWRLHALVALCCGAGLGVALAGGTRDLGSSQGLHLIDLTPIAYARSQVGVLARYARLSIFPSGLAVDYYDWPGARSWGDVAIPLVGLLAAVAATVWSLVRKPPLGFALAWPLVLLAPTSSLMPLSGELLAERRVYLALLSPAALAVIGLFSLFSRRRWVSRALVGAAAIALGAATFVRNRDFRSSVAIYQGNVLVRPGNVRARYNLANAYKDEGRLREALETYRACMRIDPGYPHPYTNAVIAARKLGLRDPWQGDEPVGQQDEAARARAKDLVEAADRLGPTGPIDSAIEHLKAAIAADPTSADAAERLGWILAMADDPARRDGDTALRLLLRAHALRGSKLNLRLGTALAAALAETGRFDDAYVTASQVAAVAESQGAAALAADLRAQMRRFRARERYSR